MNVVPFALEGLPDLLGTPGRPMTVPYALTSFARACVSKEFTLLALNKTSPIVDYLRDLAKHEHDTCGGPGVGAPDIEGASPDCSVHSPLLTQQTNSTYVTDVVRWSRESPQRELNLH